MFRHFSKEPGQNARCGAHKVHVHSRHLPCRTEVVWSEPVYQDVLTTFQSQTAMVKSDSFSLAAPAGPAGENL